MHTTRFKKGDHVQILCRVGSLSVSPDPSAGTIVDVLFGSTVHPRYLVRVSEHNSNQVFFETQLVLAGQIHNFSALG